MSLLDEVRTELSNGGQLHREPRRTLPPDELVAPAPAPDTALRSHRLPRWLRIAVGITVVLGAVATRGILDGPDTSATTPAPKPAFTPTTAAPTSTPPTTAVTSELQNEIITLSSFVENQRGLKFKLQITPTLLDNKAFLEDFKKSNELSDDDRAAVEEALRSEEQVLKAFGLLSADVDLVDMATNGVASDVFGYYDPETKRLVVRGSEVTPLTRMVLVHELTHALDDQYFDIGHPKFETDSDEADQAFSALVEGDAVRVEEAYKNTFTAADRAAIDSEVGSDMNEAGGDDYDFQPAMYFVAFPYVDGRLFVDDLVKLGGNALVDAAFSRPPESTAEVLEPDRYLAGIRGAFITEPVADGTIVDRGEVGELALFLVLNEVMSNVDASEGASTWEGDRYVAWRDGDRMCVRARFLLEAAWLTPYTTHLLSQWAAKQIDAHVEGPGTVLLTSCR